MNPNEKASHNHAPKFGIHQDGCPRCEHLREFPYVVTYQLGKHNRVQSVPVRSVAHANEVVEAGLPDAVKLSPVVKTRSGKVVAILQVV